MREEKQKGIVTPVNLKKGKNSGGEKYPMAKRPSATNLGGVGLGHRGEWKKRGKSCMPISIGGKERNLLLFVSVEGKEGSAKTPLLPPGGEVCCLGTALVGKEGL